MFELIESEGTRYTHAVSSVRKQTWDFLESIQVSVNTNTLCPSPCHCLKESLSHESITVDTIYLKMNKKLVS